MTLCAGTTPWASAAETISALARAMSGCSNWPGERMLAELTAPWCAAHEVHQAEVEHLHAMQRGDRPRVVQRAVGLDQHVDRDLALDAAHAPRPRGCRRSSRATCAAAVGLGHRDVGERLARAGARGCRCPASSAGAWDRGCARPPWRSVLRAEASTSTIICACSRSRPAAAPSSQSHVMSKTAPELACSSSALPISFSLPAKCSHAGMMGKGCSPANRASRGCGARERAVEGMGRTGKDLYFRLTGRLRASRSCRRARGASARPPRAGSPPGGR